MESDGTLMRTSPRSRREVLRLMALTVGGSLLAACGQPAAAPAPAKTEAKPTEAPKPAVPAAQPAATAAPPAKPTEAPKPAAAAPTTAPAAKPAAAVDMAAIEAEAKKEGKVVVYSSFNLDEFDKVFPLFEKRYPDVKVDHVRANGEQLIQRMITETRGGKILADVLETNSFDVFNAISQNLLEPWKAPNAAAFPPALVDTEGIWVSTRQNTDIIAWNTDQVKAGQEPKSYDEMGDPKWKGKILMEADDIEMFAGLVAGKFGGNLEAATEWLKKVAANQPEMHKGHTETTELLAAGQGAIFLGAYGHRIESLKKKKAPLEWMKTEGAQLLQVGGVVKGASHPNAAKLFFNWLLGEEGQQAISDVGRIPSRPGVKLEAPLLPAETKWYPARPEQAKEYDRLAKLWRETLGIR